MTVALKDAWRSVLGRIADAERVFCFLDYDGTLAALAPTPAEATPLPGTAEVLRDLVAAPGIDVAIVTGRPLADIRRFIDIPGLYYVGVHGLEVRLPSGVEEAVDGTAVVRAALPSMRRRLEQVIGAAPGILIEDKGATLACHYRLASRADAAAARATLETLVRAAQRRGVPVMLLYGHEVAEVRPVHINKGKAVSVLLARHAPTALPLYIGDDRTDEDAFQLLPPRAITVRVGSPADPTRARYRVASPGDVQAFLRGVVAARAANLGAPRAGE
jgi:trehalose-phosphatase